MSDILSQPEFWQKLATPLEPRAVTVEDQGEMLVGFIGTMKEAGYNSLEILGLLCAVDRDADAKVAAEGGPSFMDSVRGFGRWMTQDNKTWGRPGDLTRQITDVHLNRTHPQISGWLDTAFQGDHQKTLDTALNWNKGNYGKVLGDMANAFIAHPKVKEWAPAVIPGLATFGAAKMLGAGWGQSLALGAAGAMGGKYLYGKMNPAATAPSTPPASATTTQPTNANSVAPAELKRIDGKGSIPAPQPESTPNDVGFSFAANKNMQDTRQGAENVLKQQQPVETKIAEMDLSKLSPEQIAGIVGAVPGIFGGGLIGAATGGRDSKGETHYIRNTLIGAGLGGAITGGLTNSGVGLARKVIDKATRPVSLRERLIGNGDYSSADVLLGRPRPLLESFTGERNVAEKLLGAPPTLREMVLGTK